MSFRSKYKQTISSPDSMALGVLGDCGSGRGREGVASDRKEMQGREGVCGWGL